MRLGCKNTRRPRTGPSSSLGLILAALLLLVGSVATASSAPPAAGIASAHPVATRAGHEILADGGNAFDAAVAVSAALAVAEPYGSGLGGGGFWLLHRAADGHEVMLDGRERAPLAATRDMYLDAQGDPVPGLSIAGPLAAGIPGTPAALVHLAERYGRLPLARSLAPAIALAASETGLTLEIADNGPGLEAEELAVLLQGGKPGHGLAFSREERDRCGRNGLLRAAEQTIEQQVETGTGFPGNKTHGYQMAFAQRALKRFVQLLRFDMPLIQIHGH